MISLSDVKITKDKMVGWYDGMMVCLSCFKCPQMLNLHLLTIIIQLSK